jgi:hypothetical protein
MGDLIRNCHVYIVDADDFLKRHAVTTKSYAGTSFLNCFLFFSTKYEDNLHVHVAGSEDDAVAHCLNKVDHPGSHQNRVARFQRHPLRPAHSFQVGKEGSTGHVQQFPSLAIRFDYSKPGEGIYEFAILAYYLEQLLVLNCVGNEANTLLANLHGVPDRRRSTEIDVEVCLARCLGEYEVMCRLVDKVSEPHLFRLLGRLHTVQIAGFGRRKEHVPERSKKQRLYMYVKAGNCEI